MKREELSKETLKYIKPGHEAQVLKALAKNPKITCINCKQIFWVSMCVDYRLDNDIEDYNTIECVHCEFVNKIPMAYYMAIIYALKDCDACVTFFWKDFGMCQLCCRYHTYTNILHAFSIGGNNEALNAKGIAEKLELYEFTIIDTKEKEN
jgi:RNase P subunit RPR2